MINQTTPEVTAIGSIPFSGYFIPHSWYKNLRYDNGKPNLNAIIILSALVSWHNEDQFLLDIPKLIQTFGITERQCRTGLFLLKEKKLLIKCTISITPEEACKILKSKRPQQILLGKAKCEWCSGITIKLQSHHYPTPDRNGGIDTVFICANCHFEYHTLIDWDHFTLNQDVIRKISEGKL